MIPKGRDEKIIYVLFFCFFCFNCRTSLVHKNKVTYYHEAVPTSNFKVKVSTRNIIQYNKLNTLTVTSLKFVVHELFNAHATKPPPSTTTTNISLSYKNPKFYSLFLCK